MLSAGLVAVAFGLAVLTIWYWRFTSPRRRAIRIAPVAEQRRAEHEPPERSPAVVAQPAIETVQRDDAAEQSNWDGFWAPDDPADPADPHDPIDESARVHDQAAAHDPNDESEMGLDSDQWALLTRAVMDEYLDS